MSDEKEKPVVACMPEKIWLEHRIRDLAENVIERVDNMQTKDIHLVCDEMYRHASKMLDL